MTLPRELQGSGKKTLNVLLKKRYEANFFT